jgi:hypothetical protein
MSFIRWFPRVACAVVLVACGDAAEPAAPRFSNNDVPQLSASEPTPEELAEMPSEFSRDANLQSWGTDVFFIPTAGIAYGQSHMHYFATNAEQELKLDLRYKNAPAGSVRGFTERSTFFPHDYGMWTEASIGVSGACGHSVNGAAIHKVWHKWLVSGWKLFEFHHRAESSFDGDAQVDCPAPPPQSPGYGGGPEEYPGDCEICQEWLYFVDGHIINSWWECEPIDGSYCESGSLR